ncbi:uncharacterized protein LOC114581187 isoform X2 [Dendrobium catenatum]|uniref:uncharacterized protein LOC114581187 isoform X2 n=1 Tax=Dendrobium catenatum TaxID=906689 RepID=UPI00109F19EC|nr:uncharacterized protein LOC114581187 isoform X2 [Dendrobium catenatum]
MIIKNKIFQPFAASPLPSAHFSRSGIRSLLPFFSLRANWKEMASKLRQLQAKAVQASQFVAKHGNCYYKQLLQQNKQYVVEPRTVEKCQELSKQLFYTRIARLLLHFKLIAHKGRHAYKAAIG